MDDDIAAIEQWAQIFTNPTELAATVTKHYLLHKKEITTDISTLESDWEAQSYFQAGDDLAALLTAAVGPIQTNSVSLPPLNMVPDFVAGLIWGFTGDNHLGELQTCMKDGDKLVKDAQKALEDIKGFHVIQAVEDLGGLIYELPDVLADCQSVDDDLAEIEAWAVIFKNPVQLAKVVSKNWLFHGPAIKKDITQQKADWAAQDYFHAGADAAKVITDLVGPLPQPSEVEAAKMPLFGLALN